MDDGFAREVLRLAQGQDVECYDSNLKHQAQQLGIGVETTLDQTSQPASTSTSTSTYISDARRSISVESQASQSTGLTSNLSRTSREEQPLLPTCNIYSPRTEKEPGGYSSRNEKEHIYSPRNEKRQSTPTVSIKDYDSILSQAKHDYRRLSLNLSPPITPSPSSFSLPLSSSRESSPRRHLIRGLSRLRFHRRSESSSSSVKNE